MMQRTPFLALSTLTLPALALSALAQVLTTTPAQAAPTGFEAPAARPLISRPLALAAADTAQVVVPRRVVSVSAAVVRLGDLFSGPVPHPEAVIAKAPAPGERATLSAQWLAALAQAHGIAWRPLSSAETIDVTREGRYIASEEILAALTDALSRRGMPPNAELDVMGGVQPVLVGTDTSGLVSVIDATFDSRGGRFSALLDLPGEGPGQTLRLSGRAYETRQIPVLARNVRRDQIITEADIDWVSQRANAVLAGVITDPADMVGMAAHRSLRAGDPVRARDIGEPSLVEKGQAVTMVLKTPMMTLTAKGRALENAPMGASVRVQNLRSNKTVLGVVTAERTVVVDTSQAAALN